MKYQNQSNVADLNSITEKIIGCSINVHRTLGPGLLESIYQKALCVEFDLSGIKYEVEKALQVSYKGRPLGNFRIDLVVENQIVLELKCVENLIPIFDAQILSYMKLGGYKLGLLINFHKRTLREGIKRFIL